MAMDTRMQTMLNMARETSPITLRTHMDIAPLTCTIIPTMTIAAHPLTHIQSTNTQTRILTHTPTSHTTRIPRIITRHTRNTITRTPSLLTTILIRVVMTDRLRTRR